MEAGRELDRLVAEKVMGLKHGYIGDGTMRHPMIEVWGGGLLLPCYSTDIVAAWDVFEKVLKLRGCDVGYQKIEERWYCTDVAEDFRYAFDCPENLNDGTIIGLGETAPLAICRAALQAVNLCTK